MKVSRENMKSGISKFRTKEIDEQDMNRERREIDREHKT